MAEIEHDAGDTVRQALRCIVSDCLEVDSKSGQSMILHMNRKVKRFLHSRDKLHPDEAG